MAQCPPYAAACGGLIGGKSKPKAELVIALAVIKAARLKFMVIAPVKN